MHTDSALDFDFSLIKSKRKTLGVYIKDTGVEVRSPYWVRDEEVLQFLHDKQDWIRERLSHQTQLNQEKPRFEHESSLLFFGQTKHLHFHLGKPNVIERQDTLHVFHQSGKHAAYIKKWLRKEAELYLSSRCKELEAKLCPPQAVSAIQFRKTKSKWGHCTSAGEIQLNWLLIMAPPEVMDYVIIHEICHLTHMNHSKVYWQLVENHSPNFKAHKQWLADNGHKLSI